MNNNIQAMKLLNRMGITPNMFGYLYILEGIEIVKEHIESYETFRAMKLYEEIAALHDVTPKSVERAIRLAKEKAWYDKNGKAKVMFPEITECPTNTAFISLLAEHFIIQGGRK